MMVLSARFERTTYRLGGGRSIQLSYESKRKFQILCSERSDVKPVPSKDHESYEIKERTS